MYLGCEAHTASFPKPYLPQVGGAALEVITSSSKRVKFWLSPQIAKKQGDFIHYPDWVLSNFKDQHLLVSSQPSPVFRYRIGSLWPISSLQDERLRKHQWMQMRKRKRHLSNLIKENIPQPLVFCAFHQVGLFFPHRDLLFLSHWRWIVGHSTFKDGRNTRDFSILISIWQLSCCFPFRKHFLPLVPIITALTFLSLAECHLQFWVGHSQQQNILNLKEAGFCHLTFPHRKAPSGAPDVGFPCVSVCVLTVEAQESETVHL